MAVSLGLDYRNLAVFMYRQEMVAACGSLNGVARNLDIAVGPVFESDRRRQAGGQFAVHLAFSGTGPDRAPGNQVAQVLRRDDVEKLGSGRQSQSVDLDQQLPGDAQALVDAKRLV